MLLNCVAYQDGRRLADITPQEIESYLQKPRCFVWVALYEPESSELAALQDHFGLHDLAIEDVGHGRQRPKVEEYGDALFVVMNTVDREGGGIQVGEFDVFVGSNYVLSVRSGTRHGFAAVRERCEREPDLLKRGTGFVLYALLDAVVDSYFPVLESLRSDLDEIERQIFADGLARQNIEALYELKQKLMAMKHVAAPLLEATNKLHGGRVPRVTANTQEYFRDIYDHLTRIDQTIDSDREMITTAISASLTLIQLHDNETTKRLAAYAALIGVPTMIAGIYGMNFEHMPEIRWVIGYPLSLAVMAGIDLYLYLRLRRAGWL